MDLAGVATIVPILNGCPYAAPPSASCSEGATGQEIMIYRFRGRCITLLATRPAMTTAELAAVDA
jgi:hypothetical protein